MSDADCKRRYRNTMRGAYSRHKERAKSRGIEFNLTFNQWRLIWTVSGKWILRGSRHGKFVMGRNCDAGAYEWGNVQIILWDKNSVDGIGKARMCRVVRKHTSNSTHVSFV